MPDPRLRDFEKIVFFTGAGMSAESGVPTYRGAGGIWKQYDYRRYACQAAFDRDPAGVWEFHNFRRGLVAKCSPNAGHRLIARAEQQLLDKKITVVTQNIDGLHALAGTTNIHELHGNLWRVRCDTCGTREQDGFVQREQLRCPGCGGWWRPDIVWFGDYLDEATVRAATLTIEDCSLLVSVGTSAVVYPAAYLPEHARAAGALCVEINPDETPASHLYALHLRGAATEMLARLAPELAD